MSSSINEDSSDRGQLSSSPSRDKKRSFGLEDDFFSLSSSSDKKKKKKSKHKSNHHHHHHHNHQSDINESFEDKIISKDSVLDIRDKSEDTDVDIITSSINNASNSDTNKDVVEVTRKISAIVDRDAIRSRLQKTLKKKQPDTKKDELLLDDETEDKELEFFREDRSFSPSVPENEDLYTFTEENEKKRQYVIKVVIKLDVPTDFNPIESTDFGTNGIKKFEKIQRSILKYFKTKFTSSGFTPVQIKAYDFENTSLIWVEGKMEMKPFYKPSTLRIKPPMDILTNTVHPTVINCLLIPKENVNKLELYFDKRTLTVPIDIEEEVESFIEDEIQEVNNIGYSSVLDDEDEDADLDDGELVETVEIDDEEKDEFFTIGLKGKDNKRISIKVSPKTQIRKLLLHYLKIKNIDEKSININKAKLIFDDEELDLDGIVENTELEEDYEVQVVI
ncbi:ubiquitin-2 like Rad60 SUMO-like-domain-containing protein [Scheffersomyces coipomensis]|uniref:ubiquitin-2 like Rad60 SUMO-like-domain-containing protein n=1 Tax=Scheffersomyces coipomensis TaxID=1788519 RepID=UPI00315C70DF